MRIKKEMPEYRSTPANEFRSNHSDILVDKPTLLLPVFERFPMQPSMPTLHPALSNRSHHDHNDKFRADMLLMDEEFMRLSLKEARAKDIAVRIDKRRDDLEMREARLANQQQVLHDKRQVALFALRKAKAVQQTTLLKMARMNAIEFMQRLEDIMLEHEKTRQKHGHRRMNRAAGMGEQGQPANAGWSAGTLRDTFERMATVLIEHFRREVPDHKQELVKQFQRFVFYRTLLRDDQLLDHETKFFDVKHAKLNRSNMELLNINDQVKQRATAGFERHALIQFKKYLVRHANYELDLLRARQLATADGFLRLSRWSLEDQQKMDTAKRELFQTSKGYGRSGEPRISGWSDGSLRDSHESNVARSRDFVEKHLPEHRRIEVKRSQDVALTFAAALENETAEHYKASDLKNYDQLNQARHGLVLEHDRHDQLEAIASHHKLQSELATQARFDATRGYLRLQQAALQDAKTWVQNRRDDIHHVAGFGKRGEYAVLSWGAGSLRDTFERQAARQTHFFTAVLPRLDWKKDLLTERLYFRKEKRLVMKEQKFFDAQEQWQVENLRDANAQKKADLQQQELIHAAQVARQRQDLLLSASRINALAVGQAIERGALDDAVHRTKHRRQELKRSAGFGSFGQPAMANWSDFSLRATFENSAKAQVSGEKQGEIRERIKESADKLSLIPNKKKS